MSLFSCLYPKMKIHCWGGLGSQIFALIFLHQVRDELTRRKVELIFHSSGVTDRSLELPESILRCINYAIVSDFTLQRKESGKKSSASHAKMLLKKFIKTVFVRLRFVLSDDENLSIDRIKPWTTSIRCSYNNISLRSQDLFLVSEVFGVSHKPTAELEPCLSLHFRLGDLKTLETKSYTDPNLLAAILRLIEDSTRPLKIFSDSPSGEVFEVLVPSIYARNLKTFNLEPIRTVRECFDAKDFVGTSSKISLWIAVLRCALLENVNSYLPLSLAHVARKLLCSLVCSSSLYSYHALSEKPLLIEMNELTLGTAP